MVQIPVAYGEWVMKESTWHFMVDKHKGGRMFSLHEGCTHRELVEMTIEDYMLDKKPDLVELTYSLPKEFLQQMGSDAPIVHVTNDRQLRNMVELASTHFICLCVSSQECNRVRNDDEDVYDDEDDDKDVYDDEYDDFAKYLEEIAKENTREDGDGASIDNLEEAEVGVDDEDYSVYGKLKDEDVDDVEDYSVYGKLKDEDEDVEEVEDDKGEQASYEKKTWSDNIFVNKSFANKEALKSELRLTAIMSKFAFKVDRSDKNLFVAICRVKGCKWRLRAAVKNEKNIFWVTKYLSVHTCSVADRIAERKRYTPKYIAHLFIENFGIINGITPKHIQGSMKKMFGMNIGYTTSYRALIFAQELVRGSAEDGYEKLPSYLHQIQLANPGTVTALKLDDSNRFKYLFLAFGASIQGFQYLRRVIVVDGAHLTGKYGGVMLVAAAQDGNFQIFPLAFGIVDAEDDDSWEWFFTKLRSCISDLFPLVIVSDRHKSIKNACEKVFPWAQRGICYYHLQNNIVTKFKGKHLLYLVRNAAYAYTISDFNRNMDALRDINPDLANYLEKADVKQWSRVHFPGNRYNIKTSNIAESINSALKEARGFPISFLLEFIREKLGKWYSKRRDDALSLTTRFTRGVESLMAVREHYAGMMTVERIDGWRFNVRGGTRDCIVDLQQQTCACGVWNVEKIPCSHVIAAAPEVKLHTSTLVCQTYSKDYLYAAYSHNIFPNNDDFKADEKVQCLPPAIRRTPGRQKKSRWQSWLELASKKANKPRKLHKQYSCSKCKQPGHTRPQCVSYTYPKHYLLCGGCELTSFFAKEIHIWR